MLRGELLAALAQFGHEKTINEAIRRFHIFLNDRITSVLPPDTRKVDKFMTNYYLSLHFAPSEIDIEIILQVEYVSFFFLQAAYVAVMKSVSISNKSAYESLLEIYRQTDESEEKVRILSM